MEFRVLDLFCGAGGFSCGLDSLPEFKTLIGVDFDGNVLETFKNNIKGSLTVKGDLTDTATKEFIVNKAKELKINMIIGGPPCQGFSLKGKNLGLNDPRNFLFKEYVKIVEQVNPEVFIIENVKNLVNACDGYFIKQILEEFYKLGYIVNYDVLNAADFGVPQHRERAIIIGSKSKSICPPMPKDKRTTVRDAISDLSYLGSGEGAFEQAYTTQPQSDYQRQMREGSPSLYNHMATAHAKVALDKLALIPAEGDKQYLPKELHGKQKFSTTWARLVWDTQSPTIDTRFDTPSNGRNSHPYLNRAITPREAARIQSFPDSFVFYGKKCNVCKQIGNAVPPLLAQAIGEVIVDAYKDKAVITENCQLILGDATAIVKEYIARDFKVDAVITDPPYNISKDNNFSTMKGKRQGVDFGHWDNNFDVCGWISDYTKIIKDDGSIIIFCSYLYISFVIAELKKNGIDVKDVLIWKKKNPMPRNINRRYVQDMEFAIWGVKKNAKWTFNKPDDKPYLRSVFETSTVSGNEKTNHPTQKSLELMREIIKIHTNAGDTVLDPFMGSGTTGVAALAEGRKFIGIEVDSDYFELSKERIKV
ncbi:MAG: DNA (cytosine-5-)-methyltransferase [Candidatus Coproplasma sp.]